MKRICPVLFFIGLFLHNFCKAQAVVTGSAGADATYATLSAAFTAINGGATQTGNHILINITADLSEPGTPTALIYRSWTTLTIQPTGVRTISGSPANQLIGLNGARFVTINGINSGGNSLLISCTNTTPAITLYNAASNNTIKNLTVMANTSSLTQGVIFFSNTTAGGDNNNAIDNCDITATTSGSAVNLVYSNGSGAALNRFDTIRNCRLYDNFNPAGNANGILLDANNDSWVIENNDYYQTAGRTTASGTPVYAVININGCLGDNFKINNNRIGGTSVTHTGYTTYGPNTTAPSFKGIILNNAGLAVPVFPSNSYVTNNTIRGIQVNSNRASTVKGMNTFVGIEVNNGANSDEVYVTGNTLGGIGVDIIRIEATSITANQVPCIGIYNRSSTGNFIDNNIIRSVSMYQTGVSAKTTTFTAIYADALTNSTTSISNNSIGGNDIKTVYTAARVYGIELANTNISGTSYIILNNNISGLVHNGSSTVIYPVAGINCVGGGDQVTIAYNQLYNINHNGNIGGAGAYVAAIRALGQTGGGAQPNRIYNNTIFMIEAPVNSTFLNGVIGMSLLGNGTHYVYNNFINVGEFTSSAVFGINQNGTNTVYFYNNSVYVPTAFLGGSDIYACYRKFSNNSTAYCSNNIFRMDKEEGFAFYFETTPVAATPYIGNNNLFYTPIGYTARVGGFGVAATLPDFQAFLPAGCSESVASKEAEITFLDLPYLHTNDPDVLNAGINLLATTPLAVTDDRDGEARNACFDIGADEIFFRGTNTQLTWTGSVDTKWCTPCNWDWGIVPDSLRTVYIDAGYPRYPVIDATHNCVTSVLPQADSLNIAAGVTLTINSSALEVYGQLNNNGTISNPGGSIGFASSLKDQQINSTSDLVFNDLYIKGLATRKYLNRNTTVNTFAHCASCAADLLLGTNNLTVNGSATGSLNSHIVTNSTGTLTLKNISAAAKLFPIGHDETHYNPVSIGSGDGMDYTARIVNGISPAANSNPLKGINRTWNITSSAAPAAAVDLRFYYYDADVNGSCDPHANMYLGHYYTVPIPIWNVDHGNQPVSIGTPNSVLFNVVNWTSSNPFIVGNLGVVLAMNNNILLSAGRQHSSILLGWSIGHTDNVEKFEVMRSADGINFKSIGMLSAIDRLLNYRFSDLSPVADENFYRVKMIARSGEFVYSNIVAVFKSVTDLVLIYPSPAGATAKLLINSTEDQHISYQVFNTAGKKMQGGSASILTGTNAVPLDLQRLSKGTYFMRVAMNKGQVKTIRFVKK